MGQLCTKQDASNGFDAKNCGTQSPNAYAFDEVGSVELLREPAAITTGPLLCACPGANLHTAFLGAEDKAIRLYDWKAHNVTAVYEGHRKSISRLDYCPSTSVLASTSRDATIRLWKDTCNDASDRLVHELSGHDMNVTGLCFNKEGDMVASGSRDNTVRVWDALVGTCVKQKHIARNLVTFMRWIPGEACVVQSSEDLTIKLWDARTMDVTGQLQGFTYFPLCMDVSADGHYIVSGSNGVEGNGAEARLWDRRTMQQIHCYEGHTHAIQACLFLPIDTKGDTTIIITGAKDGFVRAWGLEDGKCLATHCMDAFVTGVVYAQVPGQFIVTCFNGRTAVMTVQGSPAGGISLEQSSSTLPFS